MFNSSRAHKREPWLICNFTARPAAQELRTEWQAGELVTSIFSQATQQCLQYPSNNKRLRNYHINHRTKC